MNRENTEATAIVVTGALIAFVITLIIEGFCYIDISDQQVRPTQTYEQSGCVD